MKQKKALVKLAQVRLAINHVLRNRMTKQAYLDPTEPEDVEPQGPVTWPENYSPYYGGSFLPGTELPRYPYSYPPRKPEAFPPFKPEQTDNDNVQKHIQQLNNYRKSLYKTKWKPLPDLVTQGLHYVTGGKPLEPDKPYEWQYLPEEEKIRNDAANSAGKTYYHNLKQEYNRLLPQYNKAVNTYHTLRRLSGMPSQWYDLRSRIYKEREPMLEKAYYELTNPDFLAQHPDIKARVDKYNQLGLEPSEIAESLLDWGTENTPLSDEMQYIKGQYRGSEHALKEIRQHLNDYDADEEIRDQEESKSYRQSKDLYDKLFHLTLDANWATRGDMPSKAIGEAVNAYKAKQKNKYLKDMNTYRSIRNMQYGLPPQTPLTETTGWITQPVGNNSILTQRQQYRSPITGKPRTYTYDAINNPYYDDSISHTFGDKTNFDQHYPRMVKQWAKQDKWDRGVQKFNQAVDKAEPLMGALTGGLSKPIFNAASLARQGVKANFPEYWQRPKHREENGIYTEY